MNKNANSRFALAPSMHIGRSKFPRHSDVKFSGNVGSIIPFFWDEILPADSVSLKTNKVIRLQTPITPFMDNIYADFHFFFCPMRLVWEHTKQFFGENTEGAWTDNKIEYTIPQITAPADTGWTEGTIADCLGVPTGVPGLSVSALPFRAVALTYDQWYRSEAIDDPFYIPVGDATTTGSNGSTYINDCVKGGMPFVAAKYPDYFTSNLPGMQRGPAVQIPLTDDGNFPVVALSDSALAASGLKLADYQASKFVEKATGLPYNPGGTGAYVPFSTSVAAGLTVGLGTNQQTVGTAAQLTPDNLWAINDGQIVGASISALRTAFQIQRMYEAEARSGGRYVSILKQHFGVTSPDARLQRVEYLGGSRVPITVNQVIQQSATDATSPQGNVAAMSLTVDSHFDVEHSFTEHGFLLGFMVLRYDHTYQQGLERAWSRKDKFDFYWPTLAFLSEQATLRKELYATGVEADDDSVFGYQERWAEYRYKPSRTFGQMRSTASQSLDSWHLGDDYSEAPQLSSEWLREDPTNVDRVLAVSSDVADQFFADIYVQYWHTRPMPVYSVPGLMDHF